jgi:hypothetical protein
MPDGPLDMDALLPASQVARYAGVSTAAVCNWVARGHLPVAKDEQGNEIRDSRGRGLYRLRDAARVDAVTSERAQQISRMVRHRNPGELAA